MLKLTVDYVLLAGMMAAGLFVLACVGTIFDRASRRYAMRRPSRDELVVEFARLRAADEIVIDARRLNGAGLVPPGLLELACAYCARRHLFNPRDPQNTEGRIDYLWKCPRCGFTYCSDRACVQAHEGLVCATARASRWSQDATR